MSDDERRQRQMDFILENQARFSADIEELKAADARAAHRMERVERVLKLAIRAGQRERRAWREKHNVLIDAQIRSDDKYNALIDAQIRSDDKHAALVDAQNRSDDKYVALVDAQNRSDDKYVALVDAQIRNEEITSRNEEIARRNSIDIAALTDSQIRTEEITRRNHTDIAALADIVRALATKRDGNGQ